MNVGDFVRGVYKTGVYAGELMQVEQEKGRALVKVLAVLKHPMQGDLHNPKEANVPFFHERKALACYEKAWMPLSQLKPFEGEPPAYEASLEKALQEMKESLASDTSEWAKRSIEVLAQVEKEYGR
ncbi:kinase-associated lipoprotein B [Halalkalibacterium halodurans]|uniref:Kinase n=1 Tax=Halalkalibacterium halodurans TaxID=86665 RepID=A0A0M0KK64_ALKHA|nr:kinase-associated lipoprotein B [Halalkalibacterium halodurans]MED3646015.1 kinase-associated lipoprotein B [Halalkalibacterium halodurans]MED4163889.1 kinase-associated lipoprotein B [Halalkalibacterium halodurans]TPE70864.1 kinase [Halalkalibacterium halodurans]